MKSGDIEDQSVVKKEEIEVIKAYREGEENVSVKQESMTEVKRVKEENKNLKKKVARLTLSLKDCKCKSKFKPEGGTIKMEGAEEVCSAKEPKEGGGEDEEGGGSLERGEGSTKVVQAKPVKRKLRGKKTNENYNREVGDEDIDDPDIIVDNEPNHMDRAAKCKKIIQ